MYHGGAFASRPQGPSTVDPQGRTLLAVPEVLGHAALVGVRVNLGRCTREHCRALVVVECNIEQQQVCVHGVDRHPQPLKQEPTVSMIVVTLTLTPNHTNAKRKS